jgi:hypothetical protein
MLERKKTALGTCVSTLLITANVAFGATDETSYSLTASFGDRPERFTFNTPFDLVLDDQYLYLAPETFEIHEDRTSTRTSGIRRSTRTELVSGAYFQYGPYIYFSSSQGTITLRFEDYTQHIRNYMQVRFREEGLERYSNAARELPDALNATLYEPEVSEILDRVFNILVDDNARIQPLDRPDYERALSRLSESERTLLDEAVNVDEVISRLEKIRNNANEELAALPDIDDLEEYRLRNIHAYDLEAGIHLEYGQLYESDVLFDRVGWFVGAEFGAGVTVYDVPDGGLK